MGRLIVLNPYKQMVSVFLIGLFVFLGVYLGWAFYITSTRYSTAVFQSEYQAHTIVGQEGYEYIFDPTTQVYIDRIKPKGSAIISYLVLKNYLPSLNSHRCTYSDPETCRWIRLNMHFSRTEREAIRKMLIVSSSLGIIAATAFYFLTTPAYFKRK